MTQEGLKKLLNEFMALPAETEWLEFKEAKDDYDFSKLGKYFTCGPQFIISPLRDNPLVGLLFK